MAEVAADSDRFGELQASGYESLSAFETMSKTPGE